MTAKVWRILARAPTYAAYVRERPRWVATLLLGRFLAARRIERAVNGAVPRAVAPTAPSRLSAPTVTAVIDDLVRDGVAPGFRLSDGDVAEIRAFAAERPCRTREKTPVSFYPDEVGRVNERRERDVLAAHYHEQVDECAAIRAIEADPLIRAVAQAYVGGDVHHIRTRLWWNFPARRVSDADLHATAQEKYHFDLNDWRTVKFFFYLTDVDEDSGAHCYIEGSHRKRGLRHQLSLMVGHDTEELSAFYGADAFRAIVGGAGTGFAEDPFIFHMGKRCNSTPRLLLEIEFGPRPHSDSYKYGVLG